MHKHMMLKQFCTEEENKNVVVYICADISTNKPVYKYFVQVFDYTSNKRNPININGVIIEKCSCCGNAVGFLLPFKGYLESYEITLEEALILTGYTKEEVLDFITKNIV